MFALSKLPTRKTNHPFDKVVIEERNEEAISVVIFL
jgi:hypothetical protein